MPILVEPLSTSAPAWRRISTSSPVSADWSSVADPAPTIPSTGTTSPWRIENPVAGDERLDRHLRKAIVAVTHGGLGDAAEQRGHLAPRAALREVFEQLPAGIHQRDYDPGQRLADRKRAGHRQRCDDVEANAALPELGDNFEQQSRKDQKGSPAPIQAAKSG